MSRKRRSHQRTAASHHRGGGSDGVSDEAAPHAPPSAAGAGRGSPAPLAHSTPSPGVPTIPPRSSRVTFPHEWKPRSLADPALFCVRVVSLPGSLEGGPPSAFERILQLPLRRLAPVFACFTTADARPLRTLSRAAEAHIASTPFADMDTPVRDLAKWRASFPAANAVKLSSRVALKPATVLYLAGLTGLDICGLSDVCFLDALWQAGVFSELTTAKLLDCPQDLLFALLTLDAVAPQVAFAAYEALGTRCGVTFFESDVRALVAGWKLGLPPLTAEARISLIGRSPWLNQETTAHVLVAAGSIDNAIASLRGYKSHAGVVTAAATLLGTFLELPAHAKAVAHAGPTPALLAVIEAHSDNPTVVASACGVLCQLPALASSTPVVMLANDALRILLQALRGCLADSTAAVNACALLAGLAHHSPARAAAAVLAMPGALDTAFAALAAHPNNAILAESGLAFLTALADGSAADAVTVAVLGSGAATIVAVATAHAGDADVLCRAVELLSLTVASIYDSSGLHGINGTPLISAGVVDTLLNVLQTCPPAVQKALCLLKLLLKAATGDSLRLLIESPLVAKIASSLASTPTNELKERLCLLWVLCENAEDATARQLLAPPVLTAVVAALRRTRGMGAVAALTVLWTATAVDAGAVATAASGVVAAALGCAIKEKDNEVVEAALRLLCRVCTSDCAAAVDAAVAAGAPAAVVTALGAAGVTPGAVAPGAWALAGMARHHAGAVAAAGGAAALLAAAQAHPDAQAVQFATLHGAATLAGAVPAAFAHHIDAAVALASAALRAAAGGSFRTAVQAPQLVFMLLSSGAPAVQLVVALQRLRPALLAAVAAAAAEARGATAVAAEAAVREEEEEGSDTPPAVQLLAAVSALFEGVAIFAGEHPEIAAALVGEGQGPLFCC